MQKTIVLHGNAVMQYGKLHSQCVVQLSRSWYGYDGGKTILLWDSNRLIISNTGGVLDLYSVIYIYYNACCSQH